MNSIHQNTRWQRIYDYPKTVFAILVLLFLWPITFGTYALQYDAIDVYLPWRFFGSESLRAGKIPFWNPYQDGGYPFYADHQYSMWNPELFVSSLFGRFSPRMQQYWFLFYFWIAGVGFLFMGKQLNLTRKSRFWGGIIFMFSGVLIGHGQSVISILGGVWLPWAIGGYLFFLKNPFSLKEIITVSICLFLMLTCGYQAVSIMLFYLLVAFFVSEIVKILRSKDYSKLKPIIFGHASVIAILIILMAGTFYAIYDVSPYLTRLGGLPIEDTDRFLFHPKSLESLLLPISSIKRELDGSTISTQSFFLGTTSIFLLFIGLFQWKKLNSSIKILAIFGLIYGITSFGANTPVQPLLAKFIPGFDQFYYASFFRFFLWISLIVFACIGLEKIDSEKQFSKPWIIFALAIIAVLLATVFNLKGSYWTIDWSKNYIKLLRDLTANEGAFINGIIQLFILTFGLILFFWKRKLTQAFLVVLIAELFISVQLMLPITVHELAKTETLTDYLDQYPEGFPLWDNDITLDEVKQHSYASFWRNQGNLSNTPSLDGWTSFHLAKRDSVYDFHPELRKELGQKPLFYSKIDSSKITILNSTPNNWKIKVNSEQPDTLIFQQANYPGWKGTINGKEVNIFNQNIFEMGIQIPKGNLTIEFNFDKPLIRILFYISIFGFLILSGILIIIYSKNKKLASVGIIVFFAFAVFKLWTFSRFDTKQHYSLNKNSINSEKELIEAWNKLDNSNFRISSGTNNLSSNLIGRIAIESESFRFSSEESEVVLSGNKKSSKSSPLFIDSSQMYLNLDSITTKLNEKQTKRMFVALKSKNKEDFNQIELVLIKKKKNDDALTFSSHLSEIIEEDGEFIHYNSILIPKLGSDESVSLFLYNINSKKRHFSDFRIKLDTNSDN